MARTVLLVRLGAVVTGVLVLVGTLTGCDMQTEREAAAPVESAESTETVAPAEVEPTPRDYFGVPGAALEMLVDSARPQIPTLLSMSNGVYSDLQIVAVQPDTVEYDYTYAQQMDVAASVAWFEANLGTLQGVADSSVFVGMAQAGISLTPKATYTYFNADGSLLWTHTFEPSS
ncbi:hypothetical protein [Cellulomonas sp. ICMP 17802]|uniref:hypothetical protein n=1 Tax=Cellulomonas sp. ICMP 17802 TaxID=3239199 RepID=UPI00351BE159